MARRLARVLLLVAAIGIAACDNEVENVTQPSPEAPTTTDTFTGTLTVNGAQTHTFVVGASGTVRARLTVLAPEAGIGVGLVLGTWNGTACASVIANDNTVQGHEVVGSATGTGTLCVRIHDVGRLTGPQNYTLEVIHP